MEKRFELSVDDILNKEFYVDIKGYNAHEVDKFLDMIIADYQKYDEALEVLTKNVKHYEEENANLRNQINELQTQVESETQIQSQEISGVDILKRLSRIEAAVFNK